MEDEQSQSDSLPKDSEHFGTVRNDAEDFGTLRHVSEPFRTVRNPSERTEAHILTVREAARMFEEAGVARTERSIINWCQPGKLGVPRLDAYYDTNERRYYLTAQSVERVIAEERAKDRSRYNLTEEPEKERSGTDDILEPRTRKLSVVSVDEQERASELEKEVLELKLVNASNESTIEHLWKERKEFAAERQDYVQRLNSAAHKIGKLEERLLVLEGQVDSEALPASRDERQTEQFTQPS